MDDVPISIEPVVDVFLEEAVTEEPPVIASEVSKIITIDELSQLRDAMVQKELKDSAAILSILNIAPEDLRTKLYIWAASGFASLFELFRYKIEVPAICSDGQSRELIPYIEFCIGGSLSDKLAQLQSLIIGIRIDFIISDKNTIILAISKV